VKWNLVEIPAINHQEHRHRNVVTTHLVQQSSRGSLVSFVVEVPVNNKATERWVRGDERRGVSGRGGTHHLMSKGAELGHDPP
jgi:hypothetical protein